MKYSSYKKGLKNLRKILLHEDEHRIVGHFGRFIISPGNAGTRSFVAIWNDKADNIVAIKNDRGVVFVRKNSVYAGQLLGSKKHKVVKAKDLARYRRYVPGGLKEEIKRSLFAEKVYQKLLANKDEVRKVQLPDINHLDRYQFSDVINMVKRMLRNKGLHNTYQSLITPMVSEIDGKHYIEVRNYTNNTERPNLNVDYSAFQRVQQEYNIASNEFVERTATPFGISMVEVEQDYPLTEIATEGTPPPLYVPSDEVLTWAEREAMH